MKTGTEPGATRGRGVLLEHLGTGAFGATWRVRGPGRREAALTFLRLPPGDEARVLAKGCPPAVPARLRVPAPQVFDPAQTPPPAGRIGLADRAARAGQALKGGALGAHPDPMDRLAGELAIQTF